MDDPPPTHTQILVRLCILGFENKIKIKIFIYLFISLFSVSYSYQLITSQSMLNYCRGGGWGGGVSRRKYLYKSKQKFTFIDSLRNLVGKV